MNKKVALVSGAKGNLGKAVVDFLLENHWHVKGFLRKAVESKKHEHFQEFSLDLLNEQAAEAMIQKIVEEEGQIDTAILTAGGFCMGDLNSTKSGEIEKQFQLNFITAYHLVRPIWMQMKQQKKGTIFLIGSLAGQDTRRGYDMVAYSLAKSLLFELANIINADESNHQIKAYVVVPSIINTPQTRSAMPNADFSQWQLPETIARVLGAYVENYDKSQKSVLLVSEEQKYLS